MCLVRVGFFALQPTAAITVVPDDAFYYLTLAQNFVLTGRWTFDQTASTSGFHLLHAYGLALVDLVIGPAGRDWVVMFALVGVGASVCLGVATALVIRAGQQINGQRAGLWALIAMVAPVALSLSTMVMESHLVVLAAAAVVKVAAGSTRPAAGRLVAIGVLGFAASLTRSDFLLLPVMLWASALVLARGDQARLRRTGAILSGAVIGFAATSAHTYWISGSPFQTSARSKLRWSILAGFTEQTVTQLVIAAVVLVLGAVAVVLVGRRVGLRAEPIGVGCLGTWFVFSVAFALMNPPVQAWYAASQLIPFAFVLTSVGALPGPRLQLVLGAILFSLVMVVTIGSFRTPLWAWQASMLRASEQVRDDPAIGHVGSWNGGILGFTSGKVVTNLDGLVDDRAAAAIERDDLLGYLRERDIEYLVDHREAALSPDPGMGFTGAELARCYDVVGELGDPNESSSGAGPVTLFRLRPECR